MSSNGLFRGHREPSASPYLLRIKWPGGGAGDRGSLLPSARCSATSTCTCSTRAGTSSWPMRSAPTSMTIDGVRGVRFAVWAPNAERVAVVGDFNAWDARRHPMRLRHRVRHLGAVRAARRRRRALQVRHHRRRAACACPHKADPVAQQTEMPPATASVVRAPRAVPLDATTSGCARRAAAPRAGRAALDLRGASRLLDAARARRGAARCGTSRSTG